MTDNILCPFSKPIIGHWCQCDHAILAERCSGKMVCASVDQHRPACVELVAIFKNQSRFILGLTDDSLLTHTQSMKIRCGGLQGMQRVLQSSPQDIPRVTEIIAMAEHQFGQLSAFPFNDIVRDIRNFSHRKKRRSL